METEGPRCLELVSLAGPSSVQEGSQAWVELTCTFSFAAAELGQLDVKWYRGQADHTEPFLLWVPSMPAPPQIRDAELRGLISVRNTSAVTGRGARAAHVVAQTVHMPRPGLSMSGRYTCRVATFLQEHSAHHHLVVYGESAAAALHIVTRGLQFQAGDPSSSTGRSTPRSTSPAVWMASSPSRRWT